MLTPDLLIKNANILTLDDANSQAGSVAVKDGIIIGVLEHTEPSSKDVLITDETEVVDLQGKTLIPGFIDTHNHIAGYAQVMDSVRCGTPPNKNIPDVLARVRDRAAEITEDQWVFGFGYDDTLLEEQRHIMRSELDEAAPDRPVIIMHISGHLALANSEAFARAGIDEDVADPSDGAHFGRDENGRLNGVLYEQSAVASIAKALPKNDDGGEEILKTFGRAAEHYLAQGITTNTDAAVGMSGDHEKELMLHLEAAKQGINPMRTQLMMVYKLMQEGEAYSDYTAEELDDELQRKSNGLVRLDSAKMFQDGSLQALTGALRDPYYQNPDVRGELFHDQETFNEEILDLHNRGFRIAIHGNGDRAIGSILDAYEHALSEAPRANHQHRIEHVQTATPEDMEKMERLDVAGSFFINHVYFWGDRHRDIFLGPDRGRRISPLKEAVDRNLLFTLHSDCPVTPISPLFSVWAAVNRLTSSGDVLGPEQQIDVITALKSMSLYGAKLIFREDDLGSIEEGKKADFAVLDSDPIAADSQTLKDIQVQATFIGGETVYEK